MIKEKDFARLQYFNKKIATNVFFSMVKKKQNMNNWWQNNTHVIEWIGLISTILGIGYGIGVWTTNIQHKNEIMELRQQYNQEIVNIKLESNQRLLETINAAQNELIELKLEKNINPASSLNQDKK